METNLKNRRRSIRLPGYDYREAGAYFVTLCTQNRLCLFGVASDGEIRLNEAGKMVQNVWRELPQFYPAVDIDVFQIMPNHLHGIIILVGVNTLEPNKINPTVGAPPRGCPSPRNCLASIGGQAQGPAPTMGAAGRGYDNKPRVGLSLPDVIHRFKTMTTKKYVKGVKQSGWLVFPGKLWQRNYYERVVRDSDELVGIQQYILDNPQRWEFDRENPQSLILDSQLPVN